MNDKNRQRHIAYEVLVILGQLALLTYITRLWPILLLVILGIFVAALRLLFLSSQKVEPVRPLPTLSPPRQPPTEKDEQCNEAVAEGLSEYLIPAQELPVTESWDAICEALIHSDFRGAHCCDEGIIIEIEQ